MKLRYLIVLMLLSSCTKVERNCSDYRTGTFEFNYTIDGVKKTGTFIRTETLNVDYFDGKADSASVRWINDCEFIQKKLNPKSAGEEKAIHMKILATTDSTYTFEYQLAIKQSNGKRHVEKGIAKKVD